MKVTCGFMHHKGKNYQFLRQENGNTFLFVALKGVKWMRLLNWSTTGVKILVNCFEDFCKAVYARLFKLFLKFKILQNFPPFSLILSKSLLEISQFLLLFSRDKSCKEMLYSQVRTILCIQTFFFSCCINPVYIFESSVLSFSSISGIILTILLYYIQYTWRNKTTSKISCEPLIF